MISAVMVLGLVAIVWGMSDIIIGVYHMFRAIYILFSEILPQLFLRIIGR